MDERVWVTARKHEAKKQKSCFDTRKTDFSKSISSPIDHILSLQRTIGNQAVQRLFKSGVIQAKLRIGQPGNMHEQKSEAFSPIGIIRGNWHSVPTIQLQHSQRCSLGSNESKVATWITRQKVPRNHYGASYNHKFDAIPTGCSLKGVQISETVSAQRDDFQTGAKNIPVGKNIWTLTTRNELHRPDDIWTPAGPKGIGANPLLNWPAVLDQNQIWYYRYSSKDRWRGPGPGFIIKVTLHGNVRKRNTLKVTTTDHGVSRTEPYRGPKIRLRKRRRR